MLLNHLAPGKVVFALATLTLLRQLPCGRGEALQGGLEKIFPSGGKKKTSPSTGNLRLHSVCKVHHESQSLLRPAPSLALN